MILASLCLWLHIDGALPGSAYISMDVGVMLVRRLQDV